MGLPNTVIKKYITNNNNVFSSDFNKIKMQSRFSDKRSIILDVTPGEDN